jgi:hypothetical protein
MQRSLGLLIAFIVGFSARCFAADMLIAGDRLLMADPSSGRFRSFTLRAARDPQIPPVLSTDPSVVGAVLRIRGTSPGDGSSGAITLPPVHAGRVSGPPREAEGSATSTVRERTG